MKTLICIFLISLSAIAADKPAPAAAPEKKISPVHIGAINDAAKDAQIAQLQYQIAQLRQSLTRAEVCSEAAIALSECELKPEGTVAKKAAPPVEPKK
jgi:hypothetical protein